MRVFLSLIVYYIGFNFFQIADPYHWLEDPDSEETKAFVDAQNSISRPFLDTCPAKNQLNKRYFDYPFLLHINLNKWKYWQSDSRCLILVSFTCRLTELWDYPKYGCPYKRGNHYYYSYNTGLQNQRSVLSYKQFLCEKYHDWVLCKCTKYTVNCFYLQEFTSP